MILASAQYATALRMAIDLTRREDPHPIPRDGKPEYYAQYLTCAGEAYILSRVETSNWASDGWLTNVRMLENNTFKMKGSYATPMSHNLAALCVDGQILLMGGQWHKPGVFGVYSDRAHWKGIYQVLLPNLKQPLDQVQPTLALTGDPTTNDCLEGRPDTRNQCEFDGKISLIRKKGTTYMYVRANVATGKRWVQMAQSVNHKDWSNFTAIKIEGLNKDELNTNVYFFNAEDWNSTHTAGLFPGVLPDGSSGIFLTFSKDMITWSRPSLIKSLEAVEWAKVPHNLNFRVPEHPVRLLNRRLLTVKRRTDYSQAFRISDRPIDPESPEQLRFVPFELEVEHYRPRPQD